MQTKLNSASFILFTTLLLLAASCTDKDPQKKLVVPPQYDTTSFRVHASQEIQYIDKLTSLVTELKRGRILDNKLSESALVVLYEKGQPNSILNITNNFYNGLLRSTPNFFGEISKASGNVYEPGKLSADGGVFGTGSSAYLFDENGLELEQMIEKGLLGAALYNHATALLQDNDLTLAEVDKLVAIFGAAPQFSNSGSTNVPVNARDRGIANYAARRDKNDGNGFYSQIKKQFIKLQAAIKAGNEFNREKTEAIVEIKRIWEQVNAATVINYCHSVVSTLSNTSLTADQKATALHAYGECVGFLTGWFNISADKIISNEQIDEILTLLLAPRIGTVESYKFITDPVTHLPKLTTVISKLKQIYNFSDLQIEEFKNNWVALQNR